MDNSPLSFDKAVIINSGGDHDEHRDYPLTLNMNFNNIGEQNCEDILWQNLVDDTSEIESNEIGVSVTQSYHYPKINQEPTIIVRWQGIKTKKGSEFRIGLGVGKAGDKNTPPIVEGSFKKGVRFHSPITISSSKRDDEFVEVENNTLAIHKGKLSIYMDGFWYPIKLGDPIE